MNIILQQNNNTVLGDFECCMDVQFLYWSSNRGSRREVDSLPFYLYSVVQAKLLHFKIITCIHPWELANETASAHNS